MPAHQPSPPTEFDGDHDANPPSLNTGSPKGLENEVSSPPSQDPGPPPEEPDRDVIPKPLSNPDPELHPGNQPLSTLSQEADPEDIEAALRYKLKGKAKVLERRLI